MSGKAYTMREMKAIVDYLTEHKAYNEIKGRKMWMDLQDAKVVNRTWQSLKETFIKRILPDINNPYYKLSMQQIASFKQGYDVEARINNRLEMRSVSRDSNIEGENQKNSEQPDSHNNKKGEDNKEPDIRDSTETLVLDDYEEPEDKQDQGQSQSKTLRELITYSEPLTPMLQAVIEDFASDGDGSNDEPKMQIVEAPESDVVQSNEALIVVLEGSNSEEEKATKNKDNKNNKASDIKENEIQEKVDEETNNKDKNEDSSLLFDGSEIPPNKEVHTLEKRISTADNHNSQSKSTENISNSTNDASLPANQEALKDKENKITLSEKALAVLQGDSNINSKSVKRRASSQENQTTSKKRLLDIEKQTNTDVETLKKKKEKIDLKKLKQNIPKLVKENSSRANPENDDQGDGKNQNMSVDNDEHAAGTSKCDEDIGQEMENPCLKSVSLYEEQFSNKKYTDSENTDAADNKPEKDIAKEKNKPEEDNNKEPTEVSKNVTVSEEVNEIVLLKSNSDSGSDSEKPTAKRVPDRVRQQRDRALANMFGFASGGVTKNRRRASSFRKHSMSRRKSHNVSTDSSEWTSDTGSEYVSPPRGRKNKQTRKYLKPKSVRVLSLEEEGGLFVMYGKKIYPVVKDGKIIKNYVSFTPEDDVDPEESYWKLKYVEEKKRTAELTKMLSQVKDKGDQEDKVPEVPSTSVNTESIQSPVKKEALKTASDIIVGPVKDAQVNKEEVGAEDKTVKVKFTKNNEEVQLEGHWSHVNPILAQVLQLLQKEPEGQRPVPKRDSVSEVSSVKSSSVVVNEQDVRDRVNKLESEIFKEIEQIEKEVESVEKITTSKESPVKPDKTVAMSDESVTKQEGNVTKRKGRPAKSQTTGPSPAKKSKLDLNNEEDKPIAARRTPRTPRNTSVTEINNLKENNTPKTRQNTPNKMKKTGGIEDNDQKVRYKLPSPNKNINTSGKEVKNTRLRKSNSPTRFKIYTSPELSHNSIDSMQGYVDSDPSPVRISVRRKKSLSFSYSTYKPKYRPRSRHTFHDYFTDDITSDSSNSFQGPVRTVTFENSSLSSNIYKSESYQNLMNNNVSIFNNHTKLILDKINEIDPILQETQPMSDQNNEIGFDLQEKNNSEQKDTISLTNTDSQCSNMTLPTSPVLSIVENISINKSTIDDFVFDEEDEMVDNDSTSKVTLNNLMATGTDVSMPLMEQECDVNTAIHDGTEYHYNLGAPKISVVSESLLNKINTVNIEDPTSDSINDKLKDLILESTKKDIKKRNNLSKNNEQVKNENTKKAKSTKRSSTPRKRHSTRKLKFAQNEPCIEEEHMETCSQVSRKSCPPVIQLCDEINNNTDCIQAVEVNKDKLKIRKKKDVIKVKISKPKKKPKESIESCVQEKQSCTQTDSGINDSGSIHLHISEDSVDLIHNHSETCLNANECLEPSIEVIENLTKSIISLDSSSLPSYGDSNDCCSDNYGILAQELHCADAQDGTQMSKVVSDSNVRHESTTATVFHTPLGSLSPPNSLMTEDLSNEFSAQANPNTKWYLFSEDETTNTNTFDVEQVRAQSSCGANLNQIFPITCAVPNLSTITEISKDNDENTRKFSEDTNSRNDIDLLSLFTKY